MSKFDRSVFLILKPISYFLAFIDLSVASTKTKYMKLALELGIQTYQILTNNDEVYITSFSGILLAVAIQKNILDLDTWL